MTVFSNCSCGLVRIKPRIMVVYIYNRYCHKRDGRPCSGLVFLVSLNSKRMATRFTGLFSKVLVQGKQSKLTLFWNFTSNTIWLNAFQATVSIIVPAYSTNPTRSTIHSVLQTLTPICNLTSVEIYVEYILENSVNHGH